MAIDFIGGLLFLYIGCHLITDWIYGQDKKIRPSDPPRGKLSGVEMPRATRLTFGFTFFLVGCYIWWDTWNAWR